MYCTVFVIFAVFPWIRRFLRFLRNKIEGTQFLVIWSYKWKYRSSKWFIKKKIWKKLKIEFLVEFQTLKFRKFGFFGDFFRGKNVFSPKLIQIHSTCSYVIFRTHIFWKLGKNDFSIPSKLTILLSYCKILHIYFFGTI